MDLEFKNPRIAKLTPLTAVRTLIAERVSPVPPLQCKLISALGRTLADDVAIADQPDTPKAARDGIAVTSAALTDAGPYMPVTLPPESRRVDALDSLPPDADAVLPFDAVRVQGDKVEAVAPLAAFDSVLPPGADATTGVPLRRAGQRLRALDIGVLTVAGGRQNVMVRAPRVRVFLGVMRSPPKTDTVAKFIGRAVAAAGAVVLDGPLEALSFRQQVTDDNVDGAIVVGGTGTGRNDQTVRDLAVHGQLAVHGMAISPGETAALGFVQSTPVLIVPGRFDAALAAWLLVGRYLIARLSGATLDDVAATLPLKRKVASAIGLTEVIPVRCAGGMAEPLGSGYLSFTALSHSDGWISVAAESEGLPAGAPVAMQPWP